MRAPPGRQSSGAAHASELGDQEADVPLLHGRIGRSGCGSRLSDADVHEDMLRFRRYLSQNFGLRMREEIKANELVKGSATLCM